MTFVWLLLVQWNALESTLLKFMLELNYRWALNARIKLFSFCFKGRSHNNWNIKYFPERSNIIWPWQHFEYLVDASTPLLEKAMAPHSSTLAWKILWTEETGRLQSWGSDTTEWLHFHFSLSCIGEGIGNPLQCSCLENPRDGEAWWAVVYGVAQSWTRLQRLSSSSSSSSLYDGSLKDLLKDIRPIMKVPKVFQVWKKIYTSVMTVGFI